MFRYVPPCIAAPFIGGGGLGGVGISVVVLSLSDRLLETLEFLQANNSATITSAIMAYFFTIQHPPQMLILLRRACVVKCFFPLAASENRVYTINMDNAKHPNCLKCVYFKVTWDPGFPRSCEAFGIKTNALPEAEVFRITGRHCPAFLLKEGLK
jgi:hypothetical protein